MALCSMLLCWVLTCWSLLYWVTLCLLLSCYVVIVLAKFLYIECRYADWCHVEYHQSKCHYTECRYAECCGVFFAEKKLFDGHSKWTSMETACPRNVFMIGLGMMFNIRDPYYKTLNIWQWSWSILDIRSYKTFSTLIKVSCTKTLALPPSFN